MRAGDKTGNSENDNPIAQQAVEVGAAAAKQRLLQNRTDLAAWTRRIATMIGDIVTVLSRDQIITKCRSKAFAKRFCLRHLLGGAQWHIRLRTSSGFSFRSQPLFGA